MDASGSVFASVKNFGLQVTNLTWLKREGKYIDKAMSHWGPRQVAATQPGRPLSSFVPDACLSLSAVDFVSSSWWAAGPGGRWSL